MFVSPSVIFVSLKNARDGFPADTMNNMSITTFCDGIVPFFLISLVNGLSPAVCISAAKLSKPSLLSLASVTLSFPLLKEQPCKSA